MTTTNRQEIIELMDELQGQLSIEQEDWYSQNEVRMRPWVWCVGIGIRVGEVLSYPWKDPAKGWRVMIRRVPGNPQTLQEVDAQKICCIDPLSHPDNNRPKHYYSDDPQVFRFMDADPVNGRSRWFILPTKNLRNMVIRHAQDLLPGCNHIVEWNDTHGFGLELAISDHLPVGHICHQV